MDHYHRVLFKRILKELGCYNRYKENFNKLERYIKDFNVEDKSFNTFISLLAGRHHDIPSTFSYFINDSFDWNRTNEGFEYWSYVASNLGAKSHDLRNRNG